MKASTPIGIAVVCIVGILAGATIEGRPPGWPAEHPRGDLVIFGGIAGVRHRHPPAWNDS